MISKHLLDRHVLKSSLLLVVQYLSGAVILVLLCSYINSIELI